MLALPRMFTTPGLPAEIEDRWATENPDMRSLVLKKPRDRAGVVMATSSC